MIGILQKTEVSISGGGTPWELALLVILLAILVIGLIVWLYRGVRKNINADDEWHYEAYSLMKTETPKKAQGAEAPPASEQGQASEPSIVEPIEAPLPELPKPAPAPAPPAEPAPSVTKQAAPTRLEAIPLVEPAPPVAHFTRPVTMPEETVPAEEVVTSAPPASAPQPAPSEPFFQTYEYEVKQEQRSRTARMIAVGVIVLLIAVYFLIFPVQEAVNSAVSNLGQRLSQLLKTQPTASDQLATLPQLDIVQEVTTRQSEAVITGRVRNVSSNTLSHLFAEIALVPVGVELTETRLVPIKPETLAPNQEGTYSVEIRTDDFSKYQLARIITADKKEITFKLSLAFPSASPRQP
ncbi:MAG: hypothetical protein HY314_14800 [Acidobacteria bacterium]|nr:hypothetical protein [Acidobacteriota bacterium]